MMAFDFFSTSSSVKEGFGIEGGGVGAPSRLTAEREKKRTKVKHHPSKVCLRNLCVHNLDQQPIPFLIDFFTC